jgi:hypothetical protein
MTGKILWLALRLTLAGSVAGGAVLGMARVGQIVPATPRDPFIPYVALLPGNTRVALRDFDCQVEPLPPSLKQERCTITPDSTDFELIAVTSAQGRIVEVSFALPAPGRSSVGRVGDLIMLWGPPAQVTHERRRVALRWPSGATAYADSAGGRALDLYLPVYAVSFRAPSVDEDALLAWAR